ncbi:ABC transporter substrate-binding protein [Aerococcus urinaehominis]|uniref:ABC transporter substrate-binding protein n=1 Tax=Aerococcus urinaehominis TaxID=128944 RepID=A0A0X8FM42_9LACT|nr:transporter substrate-binding domain-containing protein [Aerococcus urinaehominis]AMB99841.1 ABC transporter substrate-binding protein [Aerococcus urinaehominis]SDM62709.1 polar amino acid transport system substrate-binding protein [Aerococcus urinaehominis]
MKNIKKYLSLALIFALSLVLVACGAGGSDSSASGDQANSGTDNSLQAVKDRDVLRVAVWGDLKPYSWVDENGNYQGYAVQLSRKMAQDLLGDPDKVEFVTVNAEERVESLNADRVDVVMATFTKTPEREEVVDFADPYMKVAIGLASPKDAPISSADQLAGKKIILNKGTTAEVLFTEEYPDAELEKYESKHQQFQALADGRGDGLVDDNSYLFPWVKENPDFVVSIKELGPVQTNNPAVKKGNTSLLNWINETYAQYSKDGVFKDLYDQELAPFFGEGVTEQDILLDEQL